MKKCICFTSSLFFICLLSLNFALANEVVHSVLNRVVIILSMDESFQPICIGSGFIVGKHGEIATNYHVIEGASSALVKFVNKDEKYTVNNIVQKSQKYDLAIIQISSKVTPLSLGDDELASIGDRIFAIGNPEGLEGTVSEGIISGFRKIDDDFRVMQITAPISPGSSGGPIIGKNGQVIGIASSSIIVGQNLNFAVPVKKLKELISKHNMKLPFNKTNLPLNIDNKKSLHTKDNDLVSAYNFRNAGVFRGDGQGDLIFSVKNNTRKDISKIKILILWKSLSGEKLHFTPILVYDTIPSMQTKIIYKKYVEMINLLPSNANAEARIIDYEILKTSGFIDYE